MSVSVDGILAGFDSRTYKRDCYHCCSLGARAERKGGDGGRKGVRMVVFIDN
jgi:hypothetical protein